MENPLVTVLIPVFNGEKHLSLLLDSLLIQDYMNLQIIIVDDGSLDGTDHLIEKYIRIFKKKDMVCEYYKQKNQGQSFAVRNHLKYVKGDFLTWPDSDDFYCDSKAISLLLEPLLSEGFSISRSKPKYYDGEKTYIKNFPNASASIFEDCVYGNANFWFQPICYMINFCDYKKINPSLSFYAEKNAGQNWQFYLPMLSKFECKTIADIVCVISERSDSHSRFKHKTTDSVRGKYLAYVNTLENTIFNLEIEQSRKSEYLDKTRIIYYTKIFDELYEFDKLAANEFYLENKAKIRNRYKTILKNTYLGSIAKKVFDAIKL